MKVNTKRFSENFSPYISEYQDKKTMFLEIGVFKGNTSMWIADNVLKHPESKLIGVDPWEWSIMPRNRYPDDDIGKKSFADLLVHIDNILKKYNGRIKYFRGYSQDVLLNPFFVPKMFDCMYIDGHHTIHSVMRDFVLSWPLLKDGGIMIFDDYLMRRSTEVREAVDLILKGMDGRRRGMFARDAKYTLLYKRYQVAIRKIRD